ncbi:MAG: T9SS type A sorting domain-containing protein, partial [Bacteroidales bacterium]|nr:T9SS type A sorting domain-containing protein [Bacteroidales bacterium]
TSTHNEQTIYADDNCEVSVPDYTGDVTATDNCDISLDITQIPVAGTIISEITNLVTLTVTDDAGNSSEVSFEIIATDTISPVITCSNNQEVVADVTQYYTVNGTEFDLTAKTDNCGIESVENDLNNTASLANAQIPVGTTTVVWTIRDNSGNENTCSFDITVNNSVGIEAIHQKGISVYPNPTRGEIYIKFANNNIHNLSISDMSGRQIFNISELQQNEKIDLTNFENGLYIITLETDTGITIRKLLKID